MCLPPCGARWEVSFEEIVGKTPLNGAVSNYRLPFSKGREKPGSRAAHLVLLFTSFLSCDAELTAFGRFQFQIEINPLIIMGCARRGRGQAALEGSWGRGSVLGCCRISAPFPFLLSPFPSERALITKTHLWLGESEALPLTPKGLHATSGQKTTVKCLASQFSLWFRGFSANCAV